MTKKSNRGTPGLNPGQEWKPSSAPTPYRPQLRGGTPFVQTRDVDAEWSTKWNDPRVGRKVTAVEKRAK